MPLLFARHGRRRMGAAYQSGIHLNFATGVHYVKPAGGPATIAPFTSLFTFTGGNQSLYRGAAGLLIQSVTNTPRIEYDANGNLLGLLIEGARTNLALHSGDGTNAAWVKSNMTTAQTSTGPDGVANSATRLTSSAGNATILQTVTSGSATRAYSVWLRRITGTGNIDLTVDNGSTWTTKTITTAWARYDISQAAVTNPVFGVRIVTSADAVDFGCNQLESASFPSSYIPTTTGSVARTADAVPRVLGSEYSSSAQTWVAEIVSAVGRSGNQYVFSVDNNASGANRITGNIASSSRLNADAFSASVEQGPVSPLDTVSLGASCKVACAFAANDMYAIMNGGTAVSDASVTMPTISGATLHLGANLVAEHLFGHIRRLDYWPERKANAELQRLTA